jgi:hypothetical protein
MCARLIIAAFVSLAFSVAQVTADPNGALPCPLGGATAGTVVDLSVQELLNLYPADLSDIVFEENLEALDFLLKKVGENVEAFFRDIRDTTSNEQILLQRLDASERVRSSARANFNYLLARRADRLETGFQEHRADSKDRLSGSELSAQFAKMSGYMVTSGFAGHCVYLHPRHQLCSRFRYLGRQTLKPRAHVVAFAQRPETGDFLTAIVGSRSSTPVLLQGFVCVDGDTWQISRMRTDLLNPDRQTNVMRMTTDVRLSEVRFKESSRVFWLPSVVVVTLVQGVAISVSGDPKVIYRNTHRYSNYKMFRVEVRIK